MSINELLNKWGFSELIESFSENEIDENVLKDMDFNALKELIPKIGPRVKFWTKLKNYQEIMNMPIDLDEESLNKQEVDSCKEIEAGSSSYTKILSTDATVDNDSRASTSTSGSTEPILIETGIGETKYGNLVSLPYPLKATVGLPYVIAPAGTDKDSTVKQLIEGTEEGQLIAASYKAKGGFLRQKLVSLLIRNEFKNNPNKSISSECFRKLAQEIYDMFPHEDPEVYYVPYVNENGEPRAASGKLYHHYIQARKQYKKIGLLTSPKSSKKKIRDYKDDEEDDQITWLKNNNEPFPIVQEYWRSSFKTRQFLLKSSEITIYNYYKTFPCLKLPQGYSLLTEDFNTLYPEHNNNLFNNWPKFAKAVVRTSEVKTNGFLSREITAYILKRSKESLDADNFDDTDELFVMTMLPLLFTSPAPIKSNKKRWHPSKLETKEGFVLHIESSTDLEIQLDQRRKKYESFGLTAQPVPIWVGSLENIEASYVNVNDVLYKIETPLKAIDVSFKLYFALQAEYPPEAKLPWLLLQKGIYNIHENDKSFLSLSTVLSDIKQFI